MYSTMIAYFLWLIGGAGVLGFHRFYLGKFGSGILYLFTGGLFGLGSIYDLFTIPLQVREANMKIGFREALEIGRNEAYLEQSAMRRRSRRDMQGISGRDSIEQVILKTAKENNGIASPSEVALNSGMSLDDAKENLEKLVTKGFAEVKVTRGGKIVYLFSDFYRGTGDEFEV